MSVGSHGVSATRAESAGSGDLLFHALAASAAELAGRDAGAAGSTEDSGSGRGEDFATLVVLDEHLREAEADS
jgi:hypothetical protein